MQGFRSYETDRLFLVPTTEKDAAFILELLNSPKWLKYIGDRNVRDEDQAREYIQIKMIPQLEKLGYGNFTIIRKSDGVKMGTCGLYDREGLEGIDIGFAFLPDYEGMGYGFEASKKVLDLAFHEYGIKHISAITTKENIASQRLLKKLGLEFKKIVNLPEDDEELLYFELIISNS